MNILAPFLGGMRHVDGRRPMPIRPGEPIDPQAFAEVRRTMELDCFKWDAQLGDVATLAPFPLWMDQAAWDEVATLGEALFVETCAMEQELLRRPELHRALAVPKRLSSWLSGEPTPTAARVMRFDFHFTTDGWRVSEVNSDVPGGFTEATCFTRLMADACRGRMTGDPTHALVDALSAGRRSIALLNAPGHMEDHQLVAFVAARLRARGLETYIVSPRDLEWHDGQAHVGAAIVDAIYRFYQAEWTSQLGRSLFTDGSTPVCNPGAAALTESKRLPLVWDVLRTHVPTWRRLAPETRSIEDAWPCNDEWVIKPAYGNTGDDVLMRASMHPSAWRWRSWAARIRASAHVAQRRFDTVPIVVDGVQYFPCIGVYVIDGVAAGIYARISPSPVIDGFARDVAVLLS